MSFVRWCLKKGTHGLRRLISSVQPELKALGVAGERISKHHYSDYCLFYRTDLYSAIACLFNQSLDFGN